MRSTWCHAGEDVTQMRYTKLFIFYDDNIIMYDVYIQVYAMIILPSTNIFNPRIQSYSKSKCRDYVMREIIYQYFRKYFIFNGLYTVSILTTETHSPFLICNIIWCIFKSNESKIIKCFHNVLIWYKPRI